MICLVQLFHRHCVKYALIRVFPDPYFPVWGQTRRFSPYTGKYGSEKTCDNILRSAFSSLFCITLIFRSNRSQMFLKIGILKNFANFTGKFLSLRLFLRDSTQVFSCEIGGIFKAHLFWHKTSGSCFWILPMALTLRMGSVSNTLVV